MFCFVFLSQFLTIAIMIESERADLMLKLSSEPLKWLKNVLLEFIKRIRISKYKIIFSLFLGCCCQSVSLKHLLLLGYKKHYLLRPRSFFANVKSLSTSNRNVQINMS